MRASAGVRERLPHLLLPLGLLLGLGSCAGVGPRPDGTASKAADPDRSSPTRVTRDEIVRSGARTAWQALRRTTSLHMEAIGSGSPARVSHRGHGSFHLSDAPLVVLDGAPLADWKELHRIPADDLSAIRVRSSGNAAIEYGSRAKNGVIELYTHRK